MMKPGSQAVMSLCPAHTCQEAPRALCSPGSRCPVGVREVKDGSEEWDKGP